VAVQSGAVASPGVDPGTVELTVGHVIRATRERRKLSARALSLAAGLSDSYVGKVESGTCEPSLRAFAKIVGQLGLNAQEVFLILQQEARR
jgi:transcriptional regulator with XRE-family HTH domain